MGYRSPFGSEIDASELSAAGQDAINKRHTQGTDQALDTGGANQVSAAQAKAGYSHSQGDGSDHADVATNTSHATGDGSDHADVASNTSHRGTTTGNPHSVSKSDVGLGNVVNAEQVQKAAPQLGGDLDVQTHKIYTTTVNGNMVVSPNGTGAFVADDDATADARGDYAVDMQLSRANADEVASGNYSVVGGGRDNTASGHHSTVGGGRNNTASGYYYSTVGGGRNNTASGYCSTVGGGGGNEASGDWSTVGGGYTNEASNYYSTVGGGYTNTASGDWSTVGGGGGFGNGNTASGSYSTIGGGSNNEASGYCSTVPGGRDALADKYGQRAYAAGEFAAQGDCQQSDLVARNATTDATANVELFLDGNDDQLTIPTDTAWAFDILITAAEQGMANAKKFHRTGLVVNDGGSTTIAAEDTIGTDLTIGSPGAWAVDIDVDDTNDALKIEVTGEAATNIRWGAHVRLMEVSYPA